MYGYYGLAHRNAVLASSKKQLMSYVAKFKHALLFHPKIVLADHMIVNSPNFLRAYDNWPSFHEIIDKEFVEVAHFELLKNGCHMTLTDLRAFYEGLGLFHPNMDVSHRGVKTDNKLARIEQSIGHLFPDSSNRDPQFTKYCDKYLESKTCKSSLGNEYSIFETAYQLLKEDCPTLGIIHFDPEQKSNIDRTIFDYIAKLPSYRYSTVAEIIRKFSPIITHVFRALLIRSETSLLTCQIILPSELIDQRSFFYNQDSDLNLHFEEPEVESISIETYVVDKSTLASISVDLISRLRTSDEGKQFFELMQSNNLTTIELSLLREAVRDYTKRICIDIARNSPLGRHVAIIKLTRGLVHKVGKNSEQLIGTVIQLGGVLFDSVIFALGPVGTAIGKIMLKPVKTAIEKKIAEINKCDAILPLPSVESRLEVVSKQVKLTQYTS